MSKLYLTGHTDTNKGFSASGNKFLSLRLGYDEKDFAKKIGVTLEKVDEDRALLFIEARPNEAERGDSYVCTLDRRTPRTLSCAKDSEANRAKALGPYAYSKSGVRTTSSFNTPPTEE